MLEEAKKIYDVAKREIDARKEIFADGNYSLVKKPELERSIFEAEKSLERLKQYIEKQFY